MVYVPWDQCSIWQMCLTSYYRAYHTFNSSCVIPAGGSGADFSDFGGYHHFTFRSANDIFKYVLVICYKIYNKHFKTAV